MKSKKVSERYRRAHERGWISSQIKDTLHGKAPTIVKGKMVTGYLTPGKLGEITTLIKKLATKSENFKIGVTGDLIGRADQRDYRGTYRYMRGVYKTTSLNKVIELEVKLIKKFGKIYPGKLDNRSNRRAGSLSSYGRFYYVYVVYNS